MISINQLREFSIFSKFSEEQLAQFAQLGEEIRFKSQEIVFFQGERSRYLYGIMEGSVDLSILFQDVIPDHDVQYEESIVIRNKVLEKSIIVDSLGVGDILAWSALVGPGLFTSTARSTADTRLLAIPAGKLKSMMDTNPDIGYPFMSKLAEIISIRRQKVTDKLIDVWGELYEHDNIG